MTTIDTATTPKLPPPPAGALPACPWCDGIGPCSCLADRLAALGRAEAVAELEASLDAAKMALEQAKTTADEQIAAAAAAAAAQIKEAESAAAAKVAEAEAAAAEQVATAEAAAGEQTSSRPGRVERANEWWHGRHQRKLDRLELAATKAAARREYQTSPAVVALEAEKRWTLVKRVLWGAIIGGLAFTMVNVHTFAVTADKVKDFAPQWFAAWLLDPMVSLVFVALILAEEITEAWGVKIKGAWPTAAKWGGFVLTYVMNTWSAWGIVAVEGVAMTTIDKVMLHSVPPVVVLVAVETLPIIRRAMTKAIAAAATVAETGELPEPERKPRKPRRTRRERTKAAPAPVPSQTPVPAADRLVDTVEFRKIEQGEWPLSDAPVSPAGGEPVAHRGESDRPTGESVVREPKADEPTHGEPKADEPTHRESIREPKGDSPVSRAAHGRESKRPTGEPVARESAPAEAAHREPGGSQFGPVPQSHPSIPNDDATRWIGNFIAREGKRPKSSDVMGRYELPKATANRWTKNVWDVMTEEVQPRA